MLTILKKSLLSNGTLKVVSLILGYAFWSFLSQSHNSTIWVDAPVSFYGQAHDTYISAPETISLALCGKRSDLRCLDINSLALHIDASKLKKGPQQLLVDSSTLFLPSSIKLVHYSPANSSITVTGNYNISSIVTPHINEPVALQNQLQGLPPTIS